MTLKWNANEALRALETDPSAEIADVYGEVLSQCPVAKVQGPFGGPLGGVEPGSSEERWAALGHAELMSALKNFRAMSSTVSTDPDGTPAIVPLFADPPFHTPFRRLLNPNFPPEVVGRLEDDLRRYAVEMIDDMVKKGEVDFSEQFAYPFPTRVLCRFLGVPDEDWPVHHAFVLAVDQTSDEDLDPDSPQFAKPFGEIMPYVQKVIADHRENPRDDIVTSFIDGTVGDRHLTDPEIGKLIIAMMLAGHATTTAALANTVLRLAQNQPLQDLLRAEPDRIPDALEESLRIDTPQQTLTRKCLVDTELGGETISAGDIVLVNYGSANVDPARYPNPAVFDLDREDKSHLAFGFGLHACLGQHLARLDMKIALEELLRRTSSFSLTGQVQRRTYPVLSVSRMPLKMQAASVGG